MMSDPNENFLKKQTKKRTFDFEHNDGNTIKALFADKTDGKETETDKDADNDAEKETQKPKQTKRKRKK